MSGSFLPRLAYEPAVNVALGQPVDIRPTQLKAAGVKSISVAPALPAGLVFSATTGRITGTAAAAGISTHEVTLTDDNGRTGTRVKLATVGVAPPVGFTPLVPARVMESSPTSPAGSPPPDHPRTSRVSLGHRRLAPGESPRRWREVLSLPPSHDGFRSGAGGPPTSPTVPEVDAVATRPQLAARHGAGH